MSTKARFFVPGPDKKLGNRYQLLECLGDGSYGWVWRAERIDDGSIVAVKIPKAQSKTNDDLEEGKGLIGKAPHPNVVSLNWMGRVPPEREWYAIDMEYFPAVTLADMLDRNQDGFVTSYARLLSYYEQVLLGMEHLHSLGMSHGDIKPQNILVNADLVKITDFGSSLLPEDMYARSRENGGTILYSAPEVVGATRISRRGDGRFLADIYSLGILLYQLVSGRLPHDTLTQVARHAPFPRPVEVSSSICKDLDAFIMKALEHEPRDRWATIAAMREAFANARRAQLAFSPVRTVTNAGQRYEDWSSTAQQLADEGQYGQAEAVARSEFQATGDPIALLMMVRAAFTEERYFDGLRSIESQPGALNGSDQIGSELRRLALTGYLETRQVSQARALVDRCLKDSSNAPEMELTKASILAMDAEYQGAVEVLLDLNRRLPQRPAILKRLVMAYEQLRDLGKAQAFLKAYRRAVPDDAWGSGRHEVFQGLGVP
jgi:eukaryotic-like serine/threonine-protein kinase